MGNSELFVSQWNRKLIMKLGKIYSVVILLWGENFPPALNEMALWRLLFLSCCFL